MNDGAPHMFRQQQNRHEFDSTDTKLSKGDTVISNLKRGIELCKILVRHMDKINTYFLLTTSIYWWIEEYNFDGTIRHNRGLKQFEIQPKEKRAIILGTSNMQVKEPLKYLSKQISVRQFFPFIQFLYYIIWSQSQTDTSSRISQSFSLLTWVIQSGHSSVTHSPHSLCSSFFF